MKNDTARTICLFVFDFANKSIFIQSHASAAYNQVESDTFLAKRKVDCKFYIKKKGIFLK